jgi:hypothetical protein
MTAGTEDRTVAYRRDVSCHCRSATKPFILLGLVAGTTGLEPATSAVTGQRSDQLSYVPKIVFNNLD